jgi:glyoxylase-like metal-dependent hydrolase (beta-lactamase superfamily II)
VRGAGERALGYSPVGERIRAKGLFGRAKTLLRRSALPGICGLAALFASPETQAQDYPEAFPHMFHGRSGPLALEVFVGERSSVTSTLIYGPTEAVLVDAQFRLSQARLLAGRIEARHVRLKAIIITHAHEDHYIGLAVLHAQFPGTPILMSPRALEVFRATVAARLAVQRKDAPTETPGELPTPSLIRDNDLRVDGELVRVLPELQGDSGAGPANAAVWVPSLAALVTGDISFEGTHPWLAESTVESRAAWRDALDRLETLHAAIVVSGHKKSPADPDAPSSLAFTRDYIERFERVKNAAPDAAAIISEMKTEYPGLAGSYLLQRSAESAR